MPNDEPDSTAPEKTPPDAGGLSVSLADSFRQRLAREGHVALQDLWDDLLFVRLVRAPRMALRPERLALGLVMLLAIVGATGVVSALTGRAFPNAAVFQTVELVAVEIVQDLRYADLSTLPGGLEIIAIEIGRLATEQPLGFVLFVVIGASLWSVCGVAIGRAVALETCVGARSGLRASLRFAVRRAGSAIGAVLMLPTFAAAGLIAAGGIGALLFALPGLEIIGGALFGFTLAFGGVVAVVGLAYVLAFPVLTQAIAVEDDDAFDALQRALAYVIARPLALTVYVGLALVQGVALTLLIWWLASLALDIASASIGVFGGRGGSTMADAFDRNGAAGIVGSLLRVWAAAPVALAGAFAVSYVHSAGTIVYLLMRRIVDGQDIEVIYIDESASSGKSQGSSVSGSSSSGVD
ncbi:MAG: hypothetical protein AAGI53_07630 [Planctomycetota bacterium]